MIDLGASSTRVAVVADTHSRPHPEAARLLIREQPAAILHAGDIGTHQVIDDLAEIAPTHAIRGNIDAYADDTPDLLVLDLTASGARLRILLMHIAVQGPRLRADARRLARAHSAQMVVCGHSHVPLIAKEGGLAVFNPGSIGPRRFQLPITYGVIDVTDGRISLRHVDCESGGVWLPGPRVAGGTRG